MAYAVLYAYGLGTDTSMYLWGSTDGTTYSLLNNSDIGTTSQSDFINYHSGSMDYTYLKLSTSSSALNEITTYRITGAVDSLSGTWVVDSYGSIHRTSAPISTDYMDLHISVRSLTVGTTKFGSSDIDKVYLGGDEVLKIYQGITKVYTNLIEGE